MVRNAGECWSSGAPRTSFDLLVPIVAGTTTTVAVQML
jgi:hypothetical protein